MNGFYLKSFIIIIIIRYDFPEPKILGLLWTVRNYSAQNIVI